MTKFEQLAQEGYNRGLEVLEIPFKSNRIKGLYCNSTIAINSKLKDSRKKACILAEEIAHHDLTVGNILDLSDTQNRKQEMLARLKAYNHMVGLTGLIRSYEYGCRSLYEMAEFLDVTETFLKDALEAYRLKYGEGITIDNYYITFEPCLSVAKIL